MAKTQVEVNELHINKVREIALKNNKGTTKPELVELAIEIANNVILWLDSEGFENVTGLKR